MFNPLRCHRAPRGWVCAREFDHFGLCALRPKWWNPARLWTPLTVHQ